MSSLPNVQLDLLPGVVDFRWGHPDQALLPAPRLAEAAAEALAEAGPAALSYGAEQGPGRLLEQLAAWLARAEGAAPPLEQLMVTGGVSQALDMVCTLFTRPGDAVLVQSPVYHLALRIFRDHGLELIPVASDETGLQPGALAHALAACGRAGQKPAFFYTVPTFCNPTGVTLSEERRRAVLRLAEQASLLVLEDDVYHELWYDTSPPAPLYGLAPGGPVVRLGSFSKVLAPGLRLGWLAAAPAIVRRCTGCGMLDSGGGVNHFTAHVVAAFIARGWLDEHVATLRGAYRARRDAIVAALRQHLPAECEWIVPGGGFFVWLRLPPGADSRALLPEAQAAGVSYVPGERFCPGGGCHEYARLAFTLLPIPEMERGVQQLGNVLRQQK